MGLMQQPLVTSNGLVSPHISVAELGGSSKDLALCLVSTGQEGTYPSFVSPASQVIFKKGEKWEVIK